MKCSMECLSCNTHVRGTILMLVFLLEVSLRDVESERDPLVVCEGPPRHRRYLQIEDSINPLARKKIKQWLLVARIRMQRKFTYRSDAKSTPKPRQRDVGNAW